jgi:acetyltransferase-like isoleucine patch superfamily enzyme
MLKRKWQYYIYRILLLSVTPFYQFTSLCYLKYWGVNIGRNVKVLGRLNILNMNNITIGDGTRIISGKRNFVGHYQKTSLQTGQQGNITIGKKCGISNSVLISQSSITIEEQVYIGGGCCIYDNDFHSVDFDARVNNPTVIPSSPIHIGRGAFIGGHSIILKGVTIGEYAVIAAGSVVTKNVASGEIWGGVPAKKLKEI